MTDSAQDSPFTKVEFVFLNRDELERAREELTAIYQVAFAGPPYYEDEYDAQRFGRSLIVHNQRPGFQALAAREPDTGRILGFTCGYTTSPGQWWHDTIRPALGEEKAGYWLSNSFELVELAVLPAVQGKGIGGRLHDQLLAHLPHRTAVLSTAQAETAALHLYRKRGWLTLVSPFRFPGHQATFILMGYELKK